MKKLMMLMLAAACYQAGYSQSDTTRTREDGDTIRVGSIIIVNKGGSNYDVTNNPTYKKRTYKRSNISTNWLVFDIGYSGFNDRTNYNTAEAQGFLQNPQGNPLYEGDFATKGIRISNFSLWFFMQRLNLYKHVINLQYREQQLLLQNTNHLCRRWYRFRKKGRCAVLKK